MNNDKRWFFVHEEGNAAGFGNEPTIHPEEECLKKVYLTDWPFDPKETDEAYRVCREIMGPRRYFAFPADHKIAKYVVEHGVEVEKND